MKPRKPPRFRPAVVSADTAELVIDEAEKGNLDPLFDLLESPNVTPAARMQAVAFLRRWRSGEVKLPRHRPSKVYQDVVTVGHVRGLDPQEGTAAVQQTAKDFGRSESAIYRALRWWRGLPREWQ